MQKFNTVELNVTFYRLLKKEAFERWYKETPEDFTFCLKGSRFISHVKKLKDVELPLATFFNATAPLLEKLEVILWQLPPNLKLNMKNLEDFVAILKKYPVRHVFEFRHKSWLTKKVFNLLASANIAVCMADWPDFIDDLPVTANFIYIRRHGERGSYATNYTTEQLKADAKRIKDYLKLGKDVYFYFNNDAFAYAPKNAIELKTILESILPKTLKEKLDKKEEPVAPKRKKAATRRIIPNKTALKIAQKTAAKPTKPAEKEADSKEKKKAVKKAAAKKTTAKKATTKKTTAKKTAAKKTTAKKTTAKKTTAKKTAAKKTTAKKSTAKKTATKKK